MSATHDQVLVLRAALLGGDEGVAAWHEWRRTADLDQIDRGSARLLPLLWHNLLANGVQDAWLPRFKGVYRHTWFANQVWMRRVREIESIITVRGSAPIALKGTALANGYYPNPGLRPMDDLDLLVAPDDVPEALRGASRGRLARIVRPPGAGARDCPRDRARSVLDSERLDLHGHLLQGSLNAARDADGAAGPMS